MPHRDVVQLNVGGQIFATTRDTLLSEPSLLSAMFSPDRPWLPGRTDEEGTVFIDRDPRYFAPILNFLRTRQLVLDSGVGIEGVQAEAEYFQVQGALDAIRKKTSGRKDLNLLKMVINDCPGKILSLGVGERGLVPDCSISVSIPAESFILIECRFSFSNCTSFSAEIDGEPVPLSILPDCSSHSTIRGFTAFCTTGTREASSLAIYAHAPASTTTNEEQPMIAGPMCLKLLSVGAKKVVTSTASQAKPPGFEEFVRQMNFALCR
mmetsp:Transcript_20277/g.47398  ORF Transcript_20277/g.47398 Transcript_20277/m.47398 type:complete len:265 (-) Transcript_20277:44-838(-)